MLTVDTCFQGVDNKNKQACSVCYLQARYRPVYIRNGVLRNAVFRQHRISYGSEQSMSDNLALNQIVCERRLTTSTLANDSGASVLAVPWPDR